MSYILIRGGGDLASGIALRLKRCGFNIIITELPNPLAVRRTVSFSEAIYTGKITIEGLQGQRVDSASEAITLSEQAIIPVIVDPLATILTQKDFSALIDARLLKRSAESMLDKCALVIGLGPGFTCGKNCHTVIETQRGHNLGRVYWSGSASPDTGQPDGDARRVLRAPQTGTITSNTQIGGQVQPGQIVAWVDEIPIYAPFEGVLRGLIRPGVAVPKGMKIGDIDPRNEPEYCFMVSDKALSIAGGVLEAILSVQAAIPAVHY